jgi:hypothetical protein
MALKAISLEQPAATLLVTGVKRWETRSWRFRGPLPVDLAIHASAPGQGIEAPGLPKGAIIGVVTLCACMPAIDAVDLVDAQERTMGVFSPGRWAWQISGAVRLPEPVRCKGTSGLWDLAWDVEKAVRLQLERAARQARAIK